MKRPGFIDTTVKDFSERLWIDFRVICVRERKSANKKIKELIEKEVKSKLILDTKRD